MKNYQSITITNELLPDERFESINNSNCNNNSNDHPEDHLAPPFDSNERPSNLFVGTFNLIATIVGGAGKSMFCSVVYICAYVCSI